MQLACGTGLAVLPYVFIHSLPEEDSFDHCVGSWESIMAKIIVGCTEYLKDEHTG